MAANVMTSHGVVRMDFEYAGVSGLVVEVWVVVVGGD